MGITDVRNTRAAEHLYNATVEAFGSVAHMLATSRYLERHGRLPESWRMHDEQAA